MLASGRAFEDKLGRRGAPVVRRRLIIAILLIIALAVGILIANVLPHTDMQRAENALIEAFSTRRLIEARLSGGFKAGEFRSSSEDLTGIKTDAIEKARGLIVDALAKGDSSAQLPYARLLLSGGEKLSEALKYLRLAAARAPENAELHNDLGVCLIQQEKFEAAIEEFDVALKQRADMPEALFNRALSYQQLLLGEPASKDFHRAAEVEPDPGWRIEIKRRLEEQSQLFEAEHLARNPEAEFEAAFAAGRTDEATKLAAEHSESLRRHALWELSTRHLQSAIAGDSQAAEQALAEIRLIGQALYEKVNDAVTNDLGKYLAGVPQPARQINLELIEEYVKASQSPGTADELSTVFERLERGFRAQGNYVFEALSAFKVADNYYAAKRFNESIDKLKRLLSSVESREWPFDRARFLNVFALETSRLGRDSLAIKYFQQAIPLCSGSPDLESKILQYMSVPYIQLGDLDGALEQLRDSTKSMLHNRGPTFSLSNLAHNYSQLAGIYSLRNQHPLALLYAHQALRYAERDKNLEYAAEYSSFIAVENARLGQLEVAEEDLKRALGYLEGIEEDRKRSLAEARLLTNGIEVAARHGDSQRAVDYYTRAVGLADLEEGKALLVIDLLRARANAFIAAGQSDNARSDLIQAVSEIERYRANIATSSQRSHFLDASHNVFDQLISLDIGALDKAPEAFEMAERSRARALLEEISHTAGASGPVNTGHLSRSSSRASHPADSVAPLILADVQSKLPDDLTVLEYSVTSMGTYLFVITHSTFKVKELPATTDTLQRLTIEYIAGLRNVAPIEEVNQKARELYDFLIKPVESEIAGAVNLCIVPDKVLHFLPFAGLVDGSQQYLVKSRRVSYAPSASVLIRCLTESERKSHGKPENLLAVGDPRFIGALFPNLRPLEDAKTEAEKSAAFYAPGSPTLIGRDATELRVRSAIKDCDVAHLAVHCLVDERSPWLAALVLANSTSNQNAASGSHPATPSDGASRNGTTTRSAALTKALPPEPVTDPDDGLLYLSELYGMKLPRTKLVVLSACQSGLGQYYRGEGIVSLVRPLLAAGVPTVAASLWPVDSKATSDLMIEFHKQRKLNGGVQTAEALRRAQIELAHTFEHPYFWAPFIVVGGN